MTTTKPISTDFTKKGYRRQQVERIGDRAIYHQTSTTHSAQAYEVVKIRTIKPQKAWKSAFDTCEVFPASEEWGRYGYTLPTLERAKQALLQYAQANAETNPKPI